VKNLSHVEIFRGEERACPLPLACMRARLVVTCAQLIANMLNIVFLC
jgi:hypothetical protein